MPKKRSYAKKSRRRTPIKRRTTTKRSRSTKIATLTRRVNALTRATWVPYKLQWNRPRLSFAYGYLPGDANKTPAANAPFVYICPLPVAPSVQQPAQQYGSTNPRGIWSDNGCGANVTNGMNRWVFQKGRTFNTSTNALEGGLCKHVGSTITVRITQSQRNMQQYTVCLMSVKKDVADQMSLQRALQYYEGDQTTLSATNRPRAPGFNAALNEGEDFVALGDQANLQGQYAEADPVHSVMINKQIWKVHQRRKFTLGYNTTSQSPSTTSTQMMTGNEAQQPNLATMTLRIPGQGVLRYVSKPDDKTVQATELGYHQQQSEQAYFLVIFGKNGNTAPTAENDNNQPKLSIQALDSYKMAN